MKVALSVATSFAWALSGFGNSQTQGIAQAARPLDEGVPEVAAWQLQQLLPTLTGSDATMAKQRLAEALIAAQRPADALRVINSLPQSSETTLARAEALASLKEFDAALASYRTQLRRTRAG